MLNCLQGLPVPVFFLGLETRREKETFESEKETISHKKDFHQLHMARDER